MFSPINNNPTEQDARIGKLERLLQTYRTVQEEQGDTLQSVVETTSTPIEYPHQNNVRNGDLNWDRNRYIYTTDYVGAEQANVTQEAAHMFAHPKDTAIETTGSIGAASTALTIDTPDFIAGDNGVEIVVYGADTAGGDLVTTISGAPGSTTTATLAVPAVTAVTNARVRFRLLELKEDSTDVNEDADLTTNTTLKTTAHTRYATTVSDPDYDRVNGWIRWSDADNMLTCPLPYNVIVPSKQYIVSFLYKLANPVDGEDEVFVDFFGGLWDNSPGQRLFVEGQIPSLTATVHGTPGATSRDYMVLMYLSDGSTVATEITTEATTAATLSTTNYVALAWNQQPGTVKTEVYRNTGGTYERLAFPYPASIYYDTGATLNTVGGFPTPSSNRFRALTQITEANFAPASQDWQRGQMNIVVPSDYDTSKTTDIQWFCLGFNTSLTGTDSDHALLIDMISVDDKYGIFSKCPLDFQAKRNVSTAATSGSQGTTGGGGGGVPPGGGGGCPIFTDLITTDHGDLPAIDLVDNSDRYKIKNKAGEFVGYKAVINSPQDVYTLIAGDYKITASKYHPVFTSDVDIDGKHLHRFTEYDTIYTISGSQKVDALVKHFKQKHTILFTLEGPEKGFWQNGVAVHNSKEPD